MGASIALELQRSGRSVVVVDRGDAVGAGSTSTSSAVVRFNYSTLAGVTAAWESAHRWADWANHLGVDSRSESRAPLARFVQCPMVFLEPPNFPRMEATVLLSAVGVPHAVLDEDQLAERFPALDTGRFHPPRRPDDPKFDHGPFGRLDAVMTEDSGFIDDPRLASVNLMDAAQRHGCELRLRSEVVGVPRTPSGRVAGVSLADGSRVETSVVVNAAGPWSARLNGLAGVADDMAVSTRPMRQEVHVVESPSGFGLEDGGAMVADLDLGYYVRPQRGGTLLVGGVEPDCDPLEWIDDPDEVSPTPTVACFEAQVWRLARRLPELAVPHRPTGLAGVYDVTQDWVPIYDRTSLDGFYVAIGTSGNQFKNAPLVGQIVRDLVDACEAGHDHDSDPISTWCNRIERTLNLGAFSRLRPESATTGTVLG